MKHTLLLFFFLVCTPAFEQVTMEGDSGKYDNTPPPIVPAPPDTNLYNAGMMEEPPQFPGGEEAWQQYLHANIHIGDSVNVTGSWRVIVSFVIEKDGSVTNVKQIRGDTTLGKAVMRAVMASPQWTPGKFNGQVMRTQMHLPITLEPAK